MVKKSVIPVIPGTTIKAISGYHLGFCRTHTHGDDLGMTLYWVYDINKNRLQLSVNQQTVYFT